MRTGISLLCLQSHSQRLVRASTTRLPPLCVRFNSQSHAPSPAPSSAPSSSTSWLLDELPHVSEDASPLIFESSSNNPYHNLSLEHFLLTKSHPSSRILFFYTNRPSVIFGRNQNPWLETSIAAINQGSKLHANATGGEVIEAGSEGQDAELERLRLDLVRRRSGGGTVFHDHGNLNYCIIVPNDKHFTRNLHAEMVVRALSRLPASFGLAPVKVNERHDIVMQDKQDPDRWLKVSGSAYKITRGRALHHGTLLYSSPYMSRISDLLRSPGSGYIKAKGVESVRSRVGNLAWTPDLTLREERKRKIIALIAEEFQLMYGTEAPFTPILGDAHVDRSTNPNIAEGVAELMSDEWRFSQTPSFEFDSGDIEGMRLKMYFRHGSLERMSLTDGDGVEATMDVETRPNLYEMDSTAWKRQMDDFMNQKQVKTGSSPNNIPERMLQRVLETFPSWQSSH